MISFESQVIQGSSRNFFPSAFIPGTEKYSKEILFLEEIQISKNIFKMHANNL